VQDEEPTESSYSPLWTGALPLTHTEARDNTLAWLEDVQCDSIADDELVADLLRSYDGLNLLSSPTPAPEAPRLHLGDPRLPAGNFVDPDASQPGNSGAPELQEATHQVGNAGGTSWRGDGTSGGVLGPNPWGLAAESSPRGDQLPSEGSEAGEPAGSTRGSGEEISATQQDREGSSGTEVLEGAVQASGVSRAGLEYRVLDESEWMGGSQSGSDRGERNFVPFQSLSSLLAGLPALGSHFDPDFDFNIRMPVAGDGGSEEGRESGVWELAPVVDHVAATGQLKTCSEEGDCTVRIPFS